MLGKRLDFIEAVRYTLWLGLMMVVMVVIVRFAGKIGDGA